MKILNIKLSAIKSNQENPRIIKDEKFKKLVKSLKEFPEMLDLRPVVVNADMMVLGGNMRLKAAEAAGLTELPVVVAKLTKEQEKEFIIKDNVSYGEWNWADLANSWEEMHLEEWGLDIPNFAFQAEIIEDEFDAVLPKVQITLTGDVYELNNHRMTCGDSADAEVV